MHTNAQEDLFIFTMLMTLIINFVTLIYTIGMSIKRYLKTIEKLLEPVCETSAIITSVPTDDISKTLSPDPLNVDQVDVDGVEG